VDDFLRDHQKRLTHKKSFASDFGHFWKVIHEMLSVNPPQSD